MPAVAQDAPRPGAASSASAGGVFGHVWDPGRFPVVGARVLIARAGAELVADVDTDRLGYYHVEGLAPGAYELRVSRIGYADGVRAITLADGVRTEMDFTLDAAAVELAGIEVEAERGRERTRFVEQAGVTVRELAGPQIKGLPGIIEADPLRAVEVLPGIITTSDFSSAFNVRGGSADQNLILLDGIPIFNPTHLGGFFSVFNSDIIRRAELLSGGFPAQYGGRVSSVLSIETDVGDGTFHGDVGVSLLATRAALSGGLPQDLVSALRLNSARWMFSARRSYFDVLFKPVFDFPYHLNDVQATLEAWADSGNRFAITAYTGDDVLALSAQDPEDFPLRIDWNWGNDAAGTSFTHVRNDGGHLAVRASYSRFATKLSFPDFDDTDVRSRIEMVDLGGDLEARPSPWWTVRLGVSARRQDYRNRFVTGGTEFAAGLGDGWELGAYAQAIWTPTRNWLVDAGMRLDGWVPDPGSSVSVPAPRVGIKRFFANGDAAVKLALGRYSQFLHSVRDEELPIGLDIWVLAGVRAPHVVSDQIQLGYERYLADEWFVSAEAYYRTYDGVITNNFADNPNDPLDDLLPGVGDSYGVDFFLRKDVGRTTGWISVSYLDTDRTYPDFNSGRDPAPEITYPPIFDRRVDVDLVLQRGIAWGLEASLRWNLGTGLPYTLPLATYRYLEASRLDNGRLDWDVDRDEAGNPDGLFGVVLGPRNGARYPLRHRLDVNFRKPMRRSWGSLVPYLSIINVYNKKNVLFYFYEYDKSPPRRTGLSMFPLLPTIGVEISF